MNMLPCIAKGTLQVWVSNLGWEDYLGYESRGGAWNMTVRRQQSALLAVKGGGVGSLLELTRNNQLCNLKGFVVNIQRW
jgi:hypothetical protein